MQYIYLFLLLIIPRIALTDSPIEPWVTQFSFTNGWGQYEVIWVTSDGSAGYANLGHSGTLPCQFKFPKIEKVKVIYSLNKAIRDLKLAPNLGDESFSCDDETRVSIAVSHKPTRDGIVGFERRMSMIPRCNDFFIDTNLFTAASIVYENIEKLPSECKINPLEH
ncbi:hypothetical protein ACJJIW_18745 [Microbulbifer sp. JMSA004]|uniref:hypothetical protein n=1 Tax=unclassified Microbulbifer TaxID=2619833 RepID=UPI0024ADA202|nr:hypothetical protein [Microbulbifer sp. VAAF005]WHI46931.1 hypothetical protein P0078_00735 [Microbulbifer sp. VAAF005]